MALFEGAGGVVRVYQDDAHVGVSEAGVDVQHELFCAPGQTYGRPSLAIFD